MKFHERLKSYRSNMNVRQKEVAKRLNVDPSLISRYENGVRAIEVDRLPEIQLAYSIPDKIFYEMLTQADPKKTRLQPEQTKELQSLYNDALYSSNKELLDSEHFRYFFVTLSSLPEQERNKFIKKMTRELEQLKTEYPVEDHH
ncbi:helix-turn-helix domain-containing protein [Planococcus salinus]|uniref:XRE family transcriptional regulator n=1 Tax=Planococcus salinus TaxID=1848460 RepID=A0A3M8P8M6_9BACL|nr:helix-turn-helix transcriptional regulator [Planococcus salinus]RNF39998.1 XRE family transcriptional regulator [Planococcus salinus]